MGNRETNFELPKNIERYLAALSKLYAQQGKRQLQELIVNSHVRVHEEWDYDGYNGGTYEHAIFLSLPELLYLNVLNQKDKIQETIRVDLNNLHNVQNEFISVVFLEMEVVELQDWRNESGVLLPSKRIVLPETVTRIWGEGGYRVFLSHKSEVKKETSELKENLKKFGISCFVAHEDIHPTKKWQDEIENALATMDAFIALMTDGFHDSNWTDQEVGFAFGRGIPIIAVRLGIDPYGFIGKFQALSCQWNNAALEITKIFIKYDRVLDEFIKTVQNCNCYDDANEISRILPHIEKLSNQQADSLLSAYNDNPQIHDAYGFNGKWLSKWGPGLVYYLDQLTNRKHHYSSSKFSIYTD